MKMTKMTKRPPLSSKKTAPAEVEAMAKVVAGLAAAELRTQNNAAAAAAEAADERDSNRKRTTTTTTTAAPVLENDLREQDVLRGKGGRPAHPGNQFYTSLVKKYKVQFALAARERKGEYSRLVVNKVHEIGGRFMTQRDSDKTWHEMSEKEAIEKARQALSEGQERTRLEQEQQQQKKRQEQQQQQQQQQQKKTNTQQANAQNPTQQKPMEQRQRHFKPPPELSQQDRKQQEQKQPKQDAPENGTRQERANSPSTPVHSDSKASLLSGGCISDIDMAGSAQLENISQMSMSLESMVTTESFFNFPPRKQPPQPQPQPQHDHHPTHQQHQRQGYQSGGGSENNDDSNSTIPHRNHFSNAIDVSGRGGGGGGDGEGALPANSQSQETNRHQSLAKMKNRQPNTANLNPDDVSSHIIEGATSLPRSSTSSSTSSSFPSFKSHHGTDPMDMSTCGIGTTGGVGVGSIGGSEGGSKMDAFDEGSIGSIESQLDQVVEGSIDGGGVASLNGRQNRNRCPGRRVGTKAAAVAPVYQPTPPHMQSPLPPPPTTTAGGSPAFGSRRCVPNRPPADEVGGGRTAVQPKLSAMTTDTDIMSVQKDRDISIWSGTGLSADDSMVRHDRRASLEGFHSQSTDDPTAQRGMMNNARRDINEALRELTTCHPSSTSNELIKDGMPSCHSIGSSNRSNLSFGSLSLSELHSSHAVPRSTLGGEGIPENDGSDDSTRQGGEGAGGESLNLRDCGSLMDESVIRGHDEGEASVETPSAKCHQPSFNRHQTPRKIPWRPEPSSQAAETMTLLMMSGTKKWMIQAERSRGRRNKETKRSL